MSFPHDDKAWASTAAFLRGRLAANDRLLAPDPFRWAIPRAQRFSQLRAADPGAFQWVVVHKGEIDQVPPAFLAALIAVAVPVFANEVFVVFAATPDADLPDLGETDHVRALRANAAALGVALPTRPAAAARPAAGPGPRPPKVMVEDQPPRPWLATGALPGPARERAFQDEIDRLVTDYLGPSAGATVLDIGCGEGRLGRLLAEAAQVTGIDTAPLVLEQARARHRAQPSFSFVEMDATRLGFPDAAFDTVLMLDLLETLDDLPAALAEAARVLARGGRLMLTAPNRDALALRALRRLGLVTPRHSFTAAELTGMLRAVGLTVVRSDGIFLAPGWGIAGGGFPLAALEEDPEFIEAARLLGRRAGPDYALAFGLLARKS